jgi:tryptophan synthase alpha chain
VLAYARGFVYYVSITGITGTRSASAADVVSAVERIRSHTSLPIAVGFGIKTAEQAAAMARAADAAVVGSALVAKVAEHLDASGTPIAGLVDGVVGLVSGLARGVRTAAKGPVE